MPSSLAPRAQFFSQQVQKLARGVRPRLIEGGGKAPDHGVGVAKFLFVRQRVVHAVDQVLLQVHIVDAGRTLKVQPARGVS